MLLYRRKTYLTTICTLLRKVTAIFIQNTVVYECFPEMIRKILPVQIRAQTRYHIWASFIHGGLFLLKQDTTAGHIIENST
jgi:hypothetical protein